MRARYVNGAKSLHFVISGAIKKCKYINNFTFDILSPACNFIKNVTLAHVFSGEFQKIFKNTYFAEHLRRVFSVLLMIMIIARFFVRSVFH